MVVVCRLRDLNYSEISTCERAGVMLLLYDHETSQILTINGQDAKTGEISNFAGKIRPRHDRDPIETALREFSEETLGCFGHLDRKLLADSWVIYNREELILLYYIEYDIGPCIEKFYQRLTRNSEMQDLFICPVSEFFQLMAGLNKDRKIYERVGLLIITAFEEYSDLMPEIFGIPV